MQKEAKIQKIESAVTILKKQAKTLGVLIRISIINSAKIQLDIIERKNGEKGSGAQVMRLLCELADTFHTQLTLYNYECSEFLQSFYEQFDFEIDPQENDEAFLRRLSQKSQEKSMT
jgi:hypothetical protein